jgi:hypothetical protein
MTQARMAKKKKEEVEEVAKRSEASSSSTKPDPGCWPLPRSFIADPDQWIR